MKFLNLIHNSSLVALFLVGLTCSIQAQNTTRSPYSSFGIGDIESTGYAFNASMGDVKYAISNPYQINISNPASYSALKLPIFNVGINYNFLTVTQGAQTQKGSIGYLKNISLAFPVAKWWGVSFGMVPKSKMGYRFANNETVTNFGDVQYTYQGEGGINRVYFGNGFNVVNDTSQTLSLGVNASYLFGNLDKQKIVTPQGIAGTYNTLHRQQTKVSDFNFDFGLLYKRKFGKITTTFGVVYALGDSLKTNTSEYAYTFTANNTVKDTIYSLLDTGNLYLPQTFGVGFTVQLNKKQDKYNKQYLLAVDYSTTDWSKLALIGQNLGLAKQNQLSVGFQYLPDAKSYKNVQKMINYRLGFRYANTHLFVESKNITDFGMSFGVGIPIISAGVGTMFNIGMEVGRRGDKNINLISEQYTNVYFGFSLTPSKFDRWFYKSKID